MLYTQFQWALIACVAATIIFAAWTITEHLKVNQDDEPDWRNQWWLEGYGVLHSCNPSWLTYCMW